MSKAISRQKQFLKQLGHTADDQLTKEQASKLIDQLLATEKASGKTFPCPYCKKPFGPRPKRSATCPACKGKIIHMSGKFYTEEKAGALIQKDLFKEMCSSVKEEVREEWKDEKDIRKQYGDTHFVGYCCKLVQNAPIQSISMGCSFTSKMPLMRPNYYHPTKHADLTAANASIGPLVRVKCQRVRKWRKRMRQKSLRS